MLGVGTDLLERIGVVRVLPGGEGEEIDAGDGFPLAGVTVFAGFVACGVEGDFGVDELLMSLCAGGEGDEPVDGHLNGWAAGGGGVEPVLAVCFCGERCGDEGFEIVGDVVKSVAFVEVVDGAVGADVLLDLLVEGFRGAGDEDAGSPVR